MKDPRALSLDFVRQFGLQPFNDAPEMRRWIETNLNLAAANGHARREDAVPVHQHGVSYRWYSDSNCEACDFNGAITARAVLFLVPKEPRVRG